MKYTTALNSKKYTFTLKSSLFLATEKKPDVETGLIFCCDLEQPIWHCGVGLGENKNIATGVSSQAITLFHFFDYSNFSNFYH